MSNYETEATTTPVWAAPGVVTFPFAALGDTTTKLVTQEFMVQPQVYAPLTLADEYDSGAVETSANLSTHPTGTLKFVGDTEPQPTEGGLVVFTRAWSHVPQTRVEYSTGAYTFPGFFNIRAPISFTVPIKITYEYVFASGGSGIALDQEDRVTDTASLNAPLLSEVYLNNGGAGVSATTPSLATYAGYISTDANSDDYSVVAEPQSLERWRGDIYVIKTIEVKAI